jgi:hypothetical protein
MVQQRAKTKMSSNVLKFFIGKPLLTKRSFDSTLILRTLCDSICKRRRRRSPFPTRHWIYTTVTATFSKMQINRDLSDNNMHSLFTSTQIHIRYSPSVEGWFPAFQLTPVSGWKRQSAKLLVDTTTSTLPHLLTLSIYMVVEPHFNSLSISTDQYDTRLADFLPITTPNFTYRCWAFHHYQSPTVHSRSSFTSEQTCRCRVGFQQNIIYGHHKEVIQTLSIPVTRGDRSLVGLLVETTES